MSDAVSGFGFQDTVLAGADLSGSQYLVVNGAGTIAADQDTAIGVLQNKPVSGDPAAVKMLGKMMGYAGAAVAANARLKVTSGYLIAVASGDNVACIGRNVNTAASSGDIMTFWGMFLAGGTVNTASL